jgi:hypothetical protein
MKSIKAVTIFQCWDENFCLCFWVEDLDHDGVDMQVPADLQTHSKRIVSVEQHKKKSAVAHSGSAASRHWARADEDDLPASYEVSLERGVLLQCRFANDADSEPQSRWPNYGSLNDYGWETAGGRQYRPNAGLTAVFQALDLSVDPTANSRHQYQHLHETKHEGHTYPETRAEYTNVFNVDGGAIVGDMNIGPDHMVQEQAQRGTTFSGEVVPLKQYSDIAFLAWQHAAGDRTNGLKYILKNGIVNDETIEVAEYILEQRDARLQPWPGLKIPFPDIDALALMGTPSGRGAAWMLIQHKRELGTKRFSHVTLFSVNRALSLCFWIQDVQDGDMDLDLPEDLPGSSQGSPKRSAVVPINDTTSPSTSGLGERVMRAISKRTGDLVQKFWTRLRLF